MKLSLSLKRRLVFQSSALTLVSMSAFGVLAYLGASGPVEKLIENNATNQLQATKKSVELTYAATIERQKAFSTDIMKKIAGRRNRRYPPCSSTAKRWRAIISWTT
jgi:hypothetical protein